jgi:pimeloyl-ACP methyl ester carboxylesterase
MISRLFYLLYFGLTALLVTACANGPSQRNTLKQSYDRAAQYHSPDRNPVIVIPGILGSRLIDNETGQTVWGAFRGEYANPNTDEGLRLITLPIAEDDSVSNQVRPDGVLESLELNIAGIPLEIQAYSGILTTLGAGGYRDESLGLNSIDYGTDHYTCFQFDYDWRRDISYNAKRLKAFIDARRRDVQRQYEIEYGLKQAPVKFDIVAHSMGALLTRYFLRYGGEELPDNGDVPAVTWRGAADVERAVLVAPPNAGSLEAFDQLVNGFRKGGPFIPRYAPAVLGTFPSVYQLLPRPRHRPVLVDGDIDRPIGDIYDVNLWEQQGWGLSGRDEKTQKILATLLPEVKTADKRQKLAVEYQARALKRAKQFHHALDQTAVTPEGLDLFLVAGDAIDTAEYVSVNSADGDISVIGTAPGDNVVLRSSALLDERVGGEWSPRLQTPIDWSSVLFLSGKHRNLTANSVFEDNVLYWLLEDPR